MIPARMSITMAPSTAESWRIIITPFDASTITQFLKKPRVL